MAQAKGYGKKELEPLAQEALKYKTAEDFHKDFLFNIKQGRYWHITDDPNFSIDPLKGPHDMSSLADGTMDPGKLMVTSDPQHWAAEYDGSRKYIAEIDMSGVKPSDYSQVNRGFGNEFYVNDPTNAKVLKVVPLEQGLADSDKYSMALEKIIRKKNDLVDFWNAVTKNGSKVTGDATYVPSDPNIPHK